MTPAPASSNGAAWQGPNCTDAWLTAADAFGTSDYEAASLGTIDPLVKEVPYSVNSAALKTLVSTWAAGGTNRGIAMIPNGSATNAVTWYAKQTATTAWRPQLVLTYRVPTPGRLQRHGHVGRHRRHLYPGGPRQPITSARTMP